MTASRSTPADVGDGRREALAETTLLTMGELGYAATSVDAVASRSRTSPGEVLHLFADKLDLVVYAVGYYKARCVTRYDAVVSGSRTPDELVDGFGETLARTLRDEAPMHRLWYDVRAQSMFEPGLREAVTAIDEALEQMTWAVVRRYAELAGRPAAVDPVVVYGVLDGVFQQALLRLDADEPAALAGLVSQVAALLPVLVP